MEESNFTQYKVTLTFFKMDGFKHQNGDRGFLYLLTNMDDLKFNIFQNIKFEVISHWLRDGRNSLFLLYLDKSNRIQLRAAENHYLNQEEEHKILRHFSQSRR